MARLALSAIWDETRAFLSAEWQLLLPVALASFGAAAAIFALAAPEQQHGRLVAGPWLWWMLPVLLLILLGQLTISAMALRPGRSVQDSLAFATKRLPVALASAALVAFAAIVFWVLLLVIFGMFARSPRLVAITPLPVLATLIWVMVRLLPIWPVLIDQPGGPIAVLRRCAALTGAAFWPLLGIQLLAMLLSTLVGGAAQVGLGSILLLLGKAVGNDALGMALATILSSAIAAVLQLVWTICQVAIYRQLAVPSRGI